MEDLEKLEKSAGKFAEDHPKQASEAENRAEQELGKHMSQGLADEAVTKGSEFLVNEGKDYVPD